MLALIICLFQIIPSAYADNILEAAAKDISSPLQTEARHYFHLGLATTGFMYIFFKDELILQTQFETAEDKPLGDYALYGNWGGQLVPNALYAGGMYTSYILTNNNKYRAYASQMFRASLYSGLLTNLLKLSISETRPDKSSDDSFPSGHTTSAFAFASVVAMNHEWYWGLSAYAFAGFVGYSRINDNRHFLHDVVMGATIGTMYGMGIYYLDRQNQKKSLENHNTHAFFYPRLNYDGGSLQFLYIY